jgi:hypothetical protein
MNGMGEDNFGGQEKTIKERAENLKFGIVEKLLMEDSKKKNNCGQYNGRAIHRKKLPIKQNFWHKVYSGFVSDYDRDLDISNEDIVHQFYSP